MAIPVLILGESGTGKSASLRNFKKGEVAVINVAGKPLPFRSDLGMITTDKYPEIVRALMSSCAGAAKLVFRSLLILLKITGA